MSNKTVRRAKEYLLKSCDNCKYKDSTPSRYENFIPFRSQFTIQHNLNTPIEDLTINIFQRNSNGVVCLIEYSVIDYSDNYIMFNITDDPITISYELYIKIVCKPCQLMSNEYCKRWELNEY